MTEEGSHPNTCDNSSYWDRLKGLFSVDSFKLNLKVTIVIQTAVTIYALFSWFLKSCATKGPFETSVCVCASAEFIQEHLSLYIKKAEGPQKLLGLHTPAKTLFRPHVH